MRLGDMHRRGAETVLRKHRTHRMSAAQHHQRQIVAVLLLDAGTTRKQTDAVDFQQFVCTFFSQIYSHIIFSCFTLFSDGLNAIRPIRESR